MPNVCLVVIDGWGISPPQRFINGISTDTDAIKCANTPFMDELTCKFARQCIPLAAHGLAVGLPSGLMGNSEVGHLNIGAGRVVYQDIVRIDESMRTNSMLSVLNPALKSKRVHFIGLVSDGGVHSHQRHLSYLLDAAQNSPVDEIFIHAITDGRDTAPQSACKYFKNLFNNDLSRCPKAKVSTIIGRYYAMDRDKRWERTLLALEAFCSSNESRDGDLNLDTIEQAIIQQYETGVHDEFLRPFFGSKNGQIKDGDHVIFFNYRSDRMRQLVSLFGGVESSLNDISQYLNNQLKVPKLPNVGITCMTQYSSEFEFPVLSPPQRMNKVLAETISAAGRTQTHIAETEKYAHVTFFFNGGREEPFHGENRVLIPSPKVSTYDLKPEMSVMEVAKAVDHAMQGGSDCLVMCNLAPPDMVGHTGCFEPTIRAVEATDTAIGLIYNACVRENYTLIVTSDHGNAEWMLDDEGKPFTAHTCQPVPFLICDSSVELRKNVDSAALCDVAPTILALIGGIETPEEMTGKSLIINPV